MTVMMMMTNDQHLLYCHSTDDVVDVVQMMMMMMMTFCVVVASTVAVVVVVSAVVPSFAVGTIVVSGAYRVECRAVGRAVVDNRTFLVFSICVCFCIIEERIVCVN